MFNSFSGISDKLSMAIGDKLSCERMPPIRTADFILTEACTLHCDYCFIAGKNPDRRMSWNVARAAVDWLLNSSGDEETIQLTFFGGEPLLEFDLMRRITDYANKYAKAIQKHMRYAVTTNGTILSDEILEFGRQNGILYLLSVDGEQQSHDLHRKQINGQGSWHTVALNTLPRLKEAQGWVGARVTVNPDTVSLLASGVKKLFAMGVNQFIIAANKDVWWDETEATTYEKNMEEIGQFYFEQISIGSPIRITEFEESINNLAISRSSIWGCDAGYTRVGVATDGSLYPCGRWISPYPEIGDKYRLGTVFDGIFNMQARLELMDRSLDIRPKCAVCDYSSWCTGACPAASLHMMNSLYEPVPMDCISTRACVNILRKASSNHINQ